MKLWLEMMAGILACVVLPPLVSTVAAMALVGPWCVYPVSLCWGLLLWVLNRPLSWR